MRPNIERSVLLAVICLSAITVKAQFGDDYQYTLNFELDSKTGTYRPAYTYKATKGNSTIWLDGANKNKPAATNKKEDKLLIAFKWPANWKVNTNAERAQSVHPDSTRFTIFASREYKGIPTRQDIIAEWVKQGSSKYGTMTETDILKDKFKNSGTYFMYVKASEAGGAALAVVYAGGRTITVLLEFPSVELFRKHRQEMKAFLESIEVKKGLISQ